jgi:hypothetical protein
MNMLARRIAKIEERVQPERNQRILWKPSSMRMEDHAPHRQKVADALKNGEQVIAIGWVSQFSCVFL